MPKRPKERDLAKELLGQIIEQPGQSSHDLAQWAREPHATVCDALHSLRKPGFVEGTMLPGDNTLLDAMNLRATEEGRERFAEMTAPSRIKRISVHALAVLAVGAVAVGVGVGTDSTPTGLAAGGLLLTLLTFLRQR